MATLPVILLNGTTADANDVMSDFNEIYSNIDETNIAVANKTGSGRIVLQTSPTINTPTLTSPTVSGTISGAFNFSSNITFSAGITLPTTQRVNLNVGGTTYITESAANQISLYTGGTERLRLNNGSNYTEVRTGSFIIQAASNFYLDGGANTYISMASPGEIGLFTGGGGARFTVSNTVAAVDSTINFQIASTRRMYFDGGSSVWMDSPSANVMRFVTNSTEAARFDASGNTLLSGSLVVNTGQSIGVDGVGGNDYIIGSAANQISIYTGGTERLRLNNGSNYTEIRSGSLIIQSGANFFLDGGTNDYWTNSANGQNDLYAAGSLVLRTASSGPIQFFNGINLTNPVTPAANIIYSLSGARCLLSFDMNTATTLSQFNITTATRTALGQVTITWNTDFASATDYVVLATAQDAGGANHICTITQKTTFGAIILVRNDAGALVDSIVNVVAFGAQ